MHGLREFVISRSYSGLINRLIEERRDSKVVWEQVKMEGVY